MNLTTLVVATIWNSIAAWAAIGFLHLILGLAGGKWLWHDEYLLFWLAFLVLGYLKLWEDETRS